MKKKIAIIGGGACALVLACELDPEKYEVSVYEKNAALGRKFLVAGEGGFNLTHGEAPADFIERYTPKDFLKASFSHFSNIDFIKWLHALGLETYVGSSGRVFPKKGIKPIDVLNVLLAKIKSKQAAVFTKHEWKGFDEKNNLIFEHAGKLQHIKSDLVVFCMGGASWPVTGSTGDWVDYFKGKQIQVNTFEASNCAFKISWPKAIIPLIEGKALKNCVLGCNHKSHAGEIVLTAFGVEGSGIYPLSPQIRGQLHQQGQAVISIDMKPMLSHEAIVQKLKKSKSKGSYTDHVAQQLNLNALHLTLLKNFISKDNFLDAEKLATHLKNFKLSITATGPFADAISTVGGIDLQEIDDKFELKKMPQHFVVGEMLDYDAPTGGYLLQSCFSMGKFLADFLNAKIILAEL